MAIWLAILPIELEETVNYSVESFIILLIVGGLVGVVVQKLAGYCGRLPDLRP